MITAGRLSERVDILMPEVSRSETGEQTIDYVNKKTIWANVVFQRGAQALVAGDVFLNRSVVVTMRDNRLITERCRLGWDGKIYSIESFNRSKKDGSITITASVVEEGNG